MIECVSIETNHRFPGNAVSAQHKLRYTSFIERRRWNIPHIREMEYGSYGNPARHSLVKRDAQGAAIGCSRLHPTTSTFLKGDYYTAGASASSNRSSAIYTITTYTASSSEPDARWMHSGSCLPWCTTYKSCKARRHEAPSKAGNGRILSNTALPPPRPATEWSRQMIVFRSNNAALEPITAFARFGESAGGHFLRPR
jgi:hypothetical protein